MQASPYASYNQQPSANGCGGWLPIFAIIAIACLIVGYIQFHHFLVYQTYEQGRCTIQFGTVQTHSSKSGKSWTVDMGYTLSTQQGQQVAGTGYDLPATTFSSRADAQKIVESYPVGKQFPCWYNPQKPTSAALVLHSSSFLDFLRATFWFNIGFTVGLCLALFVILGTLYGGFYLPVLLMVRGIVTQGQVRLTVGSEDSDLVEGDSFQFPSSIAHKLSNPYEHPAQVIWIMSVVDSHI